jgi:hypothetical protein
MITIPGFGAQIRSSVAAQMPGLRLLLTFSFGRKTMKNEIRVSRADITSIDSQGFWLHCNREELYLPFAMYPWFEHATVAQLCRVECFGDTCLYWPRLDLELSVDTIRLSMSAPQRNPPNLS